MADSYLAVDRAAPALNRAPDELLNHLDLSPGPGGFGIDPALQCNAPKRSWAERVCVAWCKCCRCLTDYSNDGEWYEYYRIEYAQKANHGVVQRVEYSYGISKTATPESAK